LCSNGLSKIFVDLDSPKFLLKAPMYKITKCVIAALLLRLAFAMNSLFGPKEEIKCSNDCMRARGGAFG